MKQDILPAGRQVNFETYQSPFSWRYGSSEMRQIFSEINKRKTWRKVWVALARAQHKAGLITSNELADIEKNAAKIDIQRSLEIEKEIYHDVMAEIKKFASDAKIGGGKIHLGATSTDIDDNAEIIRIKEALEIIENKIRVLLKNFAEKIDKYQLLVCMGYTHLQPAEPTTLGYRLAVYAQDLLNDLKLIKRFNKEVKTKGIKGAVGTSASYEKLLDENKFDSIWLSGQVMKDLGLDEATVSGQTYPRKTDYILLSYLASIAQSLYKFCFDLRIMQSPNFGEWSEPRGEKRVGSSAMPFKKNPDKAEKVCSLARFVANLAPVAWNNAANSLLERTLDDSASRRIIIPETFLAIDECLETTSKLVEGLVINEDNIKSNLDKFGPFAATETLMMEAVKNGANRQNFHEMIRAISMKAWNQINRGKINPLLNLLKSDKIITKFVQKEQIPKLINPATHTGLSQKRCSLFLKELKKEVEI